MRNINSKIIEKIIKINKISQLQSILLSDLVKVFKKKFHTISGDCGMFALGFWKILKENNIDSMIYITSDFDYESYEEDELEDDDYYNYEGEVYHIYLKINGKLVDGVKVYSSGDEVYDFLKKYIYTEKINIFDQQPLEITSENYDLIKNFIMQNTNWVNDEITYYNAIKKLIGNRKIINDV